MSNLLSQSFSWIIAVKETFGKILQHVIALKVLLDTICMEKFSFETHTWGLEITKWYELR